MAESNTGGPGGGAVKQNILMKFSADTKDAQNKIAKLGQAQKDWGAEVIKSTDKAKSLFERMGKWLDTQEKKWQSFKKDVGAVGDKFKDWGEEWFKYKNGIDSVVTAYETIISTAEEYQNVSRLQSASTKYDLEQLKIASKGLLTETQLLQLAASAQGSQFRTSQEQLNNAASAMVNLTRKGADLGKAYDAVTKAVVEHSSEGLVQFGIGIEDATGKMGPALDAMGALRKEAIALGSSSESAGEDFARSSVVWQDAMSQLKQSIGEIVTELGPLIQAVGQLARASGWVIDNVDAAFDMSRGKLGGRGNPTFGTAPRGGARGFIVGRGARALARTDEAITAAVSEIEAELEKRIRGRVIDSTTELATGAIASATRKFDSISRSAGYSVDELTRAVNSLWKEAKKGAFELERVAEPEGQRATPTAEARRRAALGFGELEFVQTENVLRPEDRVGIFGGGFDVPGRAQSTGVGALQTSGFGSLSSLDGFALPGAGTAPGDRSGWTPEMWDANTRGIIAGSEAFATFQQVGVQAFTALIASNESFGESIKKIFGQTLMGLAAEMFSRSLLNTGLGIVAAVTGSPQAGGYFAAAAKFAAGAAVTGVLAKQFGAGGSAGGASAGAGPAVAGLGGAGGAGGRTGGQQVFIVGAEWAEQSPRQRKAQLYSTIRAARAADFGSDAVEYS